MKLEVSKKIIGKEHLVELFTIALLADGHILLESVPGTGKTTFAKTFSEVIDAKFRRIQFTPDVLPSDVTGIQFFHPQKLDFELRPGPIVTNILLADEINRATPRTQSSLLEVMEEFQVTIEGTTIALDYPFMVIATQNPVESQQGTFPLPIAQMDRFFMKLPMEYPVYEDEKRMLALQKGKTEIQSVSSVIGKEEILQGKLALISIQIHEDVEDYLLAIVRATRNHQEIELGVSPRGSIALLRAAQGKALLSGRDFVTPQDIKEIVLPVLSHRIYLSAEGSLKKSVEEVLLEILEELPTPVEVEI
ncbi:MoxR family ATPase [Caldibacillus lycopersici]|uniref:MoxR family ATPase n=2 Tax=Perspicuibacillus lycopersici TaxID=1325689 RepID=A0AAE3IT67_9BACI|nr:MoxR family ATPase [Perspicuibacillus lycopersici]